MSSTQHSDVIIAGGHLAGLFTAALLSRQGLRCTIVGHGEIEGWQTLDSAIFAEWPFLVADYEADSATQQVVETLGMRQDLRRVLPVESPMLQFIDSDERLDIFDDPDQRASELHRALGDVGDVLQKNLLAATEQRDAIAGWFHSAPALSTEHFWNAHKLKQQLDKADELQDILDLFDTLDKQSPLRQMLDDLAVFAGHTLGNETPDLLHVHAAARLLLGCRHAPGGERAALADMAAQFCTQHGSTILPDAKIASMQVARSEIVVHLANESSSHTAAFVVDASRHFELADFFAKPRQAEAFRKDRAQMQPQAWVHSLHLVLQPRGLPQGLASKSIVHSADGQNVLVSCDHSARSAKKEQSIIEGLATVSASLVGQEAKPKDKELNFLRALLMELMPFCEPYIKAEKIGSSRPLWGRDDEKTDILGPRRGIKTSHPRLLKVGPEVLSAWGLEGELRAAWETAKIILDKLKKNE